jgi:hypothetical protein
MTGVGRTYPYPDAAEDESFALANGRFTPDLGPTGTAYITFL